MPSTPAASVAVRPRTYISTMICRCASVSRASAAATDSRDSARSISSSAGTVSAAVAATSRGRTAARRALSTITRRATVNSQPRDDRWSACSVAACRQARISVSCTTSSAACRSPPSRRVQ